MRLDTDKRSQFHSRTLLGPLLQSLGLVPHKPPQELPAWVLWDGVHELNSSCEMLVRNLGVRNVLFEWGVSVLKEALSGIRSYLANRLFNLRHSFRTSFGDLLGFRARNNESHRDLSAELIRNPNHANVADVWVV